MHIECTTTHAAGEVLSLLMEHRLWPGHTFHLAGPSLPDPPIHIILSVKLHPDIVAQLQTIADVSIADEAAL